LAKSDEKKDYRSERQNGKNIFLEKSLIQLLR